eukprot:scaffold1970_cov396-Prasinococcus_capsulatus_cf.AAC.38
MPSSPAHARSQYPWGSLGPRAAGADKDRGPARAWPRHIHFDLPHSRGPAASSEPLRRGAGPERLHCRCPLPDPLPLVPRRASARPPSWQEAARALPPRTPHASARVATPSHAAAEMMMLLLATARRRGRRAQT